MMIRVFASLSLALLIALYFGASDLKYETKEAREELQDIDRSIEREKEAISVLSAEWSHLTRPDNLRKLAAAHLGLDLVRAEQIAAIEDVPFLGFDLFDKEPGAVPVRHETRPPQKPQVSIAAVGPGSAEGAPLALTLAQVEFFRDERQGY